MLEMVRPHILVNSIADYYDVPGLKNQANDNVCQILKHFWGAGCIGPAVELAYNSSSDTGLLSTLNEAVAEHMTELIDREDFVRFPLLNRFSAGVIQELTRRRLLVNDNSC